MNSTTPPPPSSDTVTTTPAPRPPRSGGRKALITVSAIVGGVVLLGAGTMAAVGAVRQITSANAGDASSTVDASGVTSIDVEAGGADVTVRFGDVTEAVLEVSGQSDTWTLERDDDEIVVRDPRLGFGWWMGDWFGDATVVTLTLPQELSGRIDADLSLSAGSMRANGDFAELDLDVSAGTLTAEGSARSVSADLSAGRVDIRLDDVQEIDLSASAGQIFAEFGGSAPDAVSIGMSAGNTEVTLPDVEYAVSEDISAGSLDNGLRTASSSSHTVSVSVAAGSVELRRGR